MAATGSGPLSGRRVVELGRALAAPWAGQMLADLGAEVIKVERPGTGDDTRGWGPPFLASGESAYFLGANRGKQSIELDVKTADGQRVVRELAAEADILIENFKAGALAAMGLGYDDLAQTHPHLVYCSISGFGQSGPRSVQPAYDFAIQAMGGLMSITGEQDGLAGGPQKVGVPIIDMTTGMYAVIGILGALERRHATGRGDWVAVSMLDVEVALLSNQAMSYLISGKVPGRTGNRHPSIQPQDVFPCRDGDIAIAVGTDAQFAALCAVLGLEGIAESEQFARNSERVQNADRLRSLLADRLRQADRGRWVEALSASGVPCAPINSIDEVFADPQVIHNGVVTELAHPTAGTVPQIGIPIRMRSADLGPRLRPPLLGEHTEAVLRRLDGGAEASRAARGGRAR
ncbi:MAG: CoA transferase [Microbacterium sp.]|nr:CoA transferase [Microbacterium sp.]